MSLADVDLTLVESMQDVELFLRWLGERRPILALDIETSGLHLARDRIRLVQFGDSKSGWAIPYDEWRGVIRHTLATYDRPLVLQHAKFDAGFLLRDGLPFPWEQVHDTMMMSFLFDSLGPKSLKAAAAAYVDPAARAGEQELKKLMAKNHWDYGSVPIELPQYWGYGAMDTVLTARLAEKLWPQIQYAREAYDIEMACERVLCGMERRGVTIDVPYCASTHDEMVRELDIVRARLGGVSPNNAAQIVNALQAAGVGLTKRTASGQLSTDDEVLSAIDHPIAQDVLTARTATKIISSYFVNFLAYHNNGILHPHINQLAARTGRMSVTEPALQTIPRKAAVRDAFIPRPGSKLVLIDYDNQELRVAAHFARDEAMLAAFREGRDLHMETARRLYGEGATREQRSTAKAAMFSKAYGAGIEKFARTTGLSYGEAQAVFATLNQIYPGMNTVMGEITKHVRERAGDGALGYVRAIDGRHLRVKANKAYVGFNALIQGSCAVVLKRALIDLDAAGFGKYILLPIHDEIMFDVPADQIEDGIVEDIKRVMTREDFAAPLTVGAKVVDRWGDPYR